MIIYLSNKMSVFPLLIKTPKNGTIINRNGFHLHMKFDLNKEKAALKELQLKATPKRLAILQAMAGHRRYLCPEEIWKILNKRFKRLGLPTVYRILDELANGEIVSCIIRPDRRLYYYLCMNKKHHHHFVCDSCRKVEDLDICIAKKIVREAKKRFGGIVKSHIFQVDGLCSDCRKKKR